MALPGFKSEVADPDLMVLGQIIVKHYLYAASRVEKKDFMSEVIERFYKAPVTKFTDEMTNFKIVIQGSPDYYNDALLFVMGVVADLVVPDHYFKKLMLEYDRIISGMPQNDMLSVKLDATNYFECVFFAIRFFVDQADLIAEIPPEEQPGKEGKK